MNTTLLIPKNQTTSILLKYPRRFNRLKNTNYFRSDSTESASSYNVFENNDITVEEILFSDNDLRYFGANMDNFETSDIDINKMENIILPNGTFSSTQVFLDKCLTVVEQIYRYNRDIKSTLQQILLLGGSISSDSTNSKLLEYYLPELKSDMIDALNSRDVIDPVVLELHVQNEGCVVSSILLFMQQTTKGAFTSGLMLKTVNMESGNKRKKRLREGEIDVKKASVVAFFESFTSHHSDYKIRFLEAMLSTSKTNMITYPVDTIVDVLNFNNPPVAIFALLVKCLMKIAEACGHARDAQAKKRKCWSCVMTYGSRKLADRDGFSVYLVAALAKALKDSDATLFPTIQTMLSNVETWPIETFTAEKGKLPKLFLEQYFSTEALRGTFSKSLLKPGNFNWIQSYLCYMVVEKDSEAIVSFFDSIESLFQEEKQGYGDFFQIYAEELANFVFDILQSNKFDLNVIIKAATALWRFCATITPTIQKKIPTVVNIYKNYGENLEVSHMLCRGIFYLINEHPQELAVFTSNGGAVALIGTLLRFADDANIDEYCNRSLDVVKTQSSFQLASSEVLKEIGLRLYEANTESGVITITHLVNSWGILSSNIRALPEELYRGFANALQKYYRNSDVIIALLEIVAAMNSKFDWVLFGECGAVSAFNDILRQCPLTEEYKDICNKLIKLLPRDDEMEILTGWCSDECKLQDVISLFQSSGCHSTCKKLMIVLNQYLLDTTPERASTNFINMTDIIAAIVIQAFASSVKSQDANALGVCIEITLKLFQISSSAVVSDAFCNAHLCEQLAAILSMTEARNDTVVMGKLADLFSFSSISDKNAGLNAVDMVKIGLLGGCEYIVDAMKESYANRNMEVFLHCCKIALKLSDLSIENCLRFLEFNGDVLLHNLDVNHVTPAINGLIHQIFEKLTATRSRRSIVVAAAVYVKSEKI